MDKCTNCQELKIKFLDESIKRQELEKNFNNLYKIAESNRKSCEQFSIFLSKLANGESFDKMEIIRQFKNFVSLKEANTLAKKFTV